MKILVLQGPNLNLLGLASRQNGTRLTLDKLNRALRRRARELDVRLAIHQIQSQAKASRLVQRQRNLASGVLLIPGIWATTGHLLLETLQLVSLPLAVFHLEPEQGPWHYHDRSIFRERAQLEEFGSMPDELCSLLSDFVSLLNR